MAKLAPTVPGILTRHREMLESALREAVGTDSAPLAAAARYVMGWEDQHGDPAANEGKRVRPALCLFAAEAAGGSPRDALPGAVAVELVHNFSLVHDEVQDRDDERHHRPTAWRLHGEGQAINLGDFLFTRALRALCDHDGPAERRMAALAVLNRAIERMIRGQWSDIAFESRDAVNVDEYLEMVAGKTGALLGAPLEMGALLAGAHPGFAAALGAWGEHVGLAFQAQDDYLGIWGEPDLTGKSNTNDLARKKKTLPVVAGLANAQAARLIAGAFERPEVTPDDIAAITRALELAGADSACRDLARRHATEADRLLEGLDLTPALRDDFSAVAAYLVDRNF